MILKPIFLEIPIPLELTISNKKWLIMFAYRPPVESNKLTFF